MNPNRTEVMLVEKADVLKGGVLPTFDGVQLTLAISLPVSLPFILN